MMQAFSARLTAAVELLDGGPYEAAEMADNLADLRHYNRDYGGSRLARSGVAALLRSGGPSFLTLLDIGTGSADIPLALARWAESRGIAVRAQGLDSNGDVLAEAERYLASRGAAASITLVKGDATRLPHADGSIDLVVCSNFLHHLETAAAREALSEMRRVAGLGVVVVDLVRGPLSWLSVWLLTRFTTRNRLTRHDGPLSVRRAFTTRELRRLAGAAGMDRARVRRAGAARMVLTWRRCMEGDRA